MVVSFVYNEMKQPFWSYKFSQNLQQFVF